MVDPKTESCTAEMEEAIFEELSTTTDLSAEEMNGIEGGAANYFQSGGAFTHAEKADVFYDQTIMGASVSTINGILAGASSSNTANLEYSLGEKGNYYLGEIKGSADTASNSDFLAAVQKDVTDITNDGANTFSSMESASVAPDQVERNAFTAKEDLQAEIVTAAVSGLQEAAAPIVSTATGATTGNGKWLLSHIYINSNAPEPDAATTYENNFWDGEANAPQAQPTLNLAGHQITMPIIGGIAGETLEQMQKDFQQTVITDTTKDLEQDGLSQAQVASALKELNE